MVRKYAIVAVVASLLALATMPGARAVGLPPEDYNNPKTFVTIATPDNPEPVEKLAAEEMARWIRALTPNKVSIAPISQAAKMPGAEKIAVYLYGRPMPLQKLMDTFTEDTITKPLGFNSYSYHSAILGTKSLFAVTGSDPQGLLYGVQTGAANIATSTMGLPIPDPNLEYPKRQMTHIEERMMGVVDMQKPTYRHRLLTLPDAWNGAGATNPFAGKDAVEFARLVTRLRFNTISGLPGGAKMSPKQRGAWIAILRRYYIDVLAPLDLRAQLPAPEKMGAKLASAMAAYPGAAGSYVILPEAPTAKLAPAIKAAEKAAKTRILMLDNLRPDPALASVFANQPDTVWAGVRWTNGATPDSFLPPLKAWGVRVMIDWPLPHPDTAPIGLGSPQWMASVQAKYASESYRAPNFGGFVTIIGSLKPGTLDDLSLNTAGYLAWQPVQFMPTLYFAQYLSYCIRPEVAADIDKATYLQSDSIQGFVSRYPAAKPGHGLLRYLGLKPLKSLQNAKLVELEQLLRRLAEQQRTTTQLIEDTGVKLSDRKNPRYSYLLAQARFYRDLLISRQAMAQMLIEKGSPSARKTAMDAISEMEIQVKEMAKTAPNMEAKAEFAALATALAAEKKEIQLFK